MSGSAKTTVKGRIGSLLATLFFLPFLGFGIFALVLSVRFLTGGGEGSTASNLMGALFTLIFGVIFSGVGGIGVFACLATALGFSRPSLRPSARRKPGKRARSGSFQTDCFPPLRDLPRGPAGGVLLDPEMARGLKAAGMWFFALFWNGITWVAIAITWRESDLAWFLIIFLGLFAVIGAAILAGAIKETARAVMIGDTSVEIPREPAVLGGRFPVTVYQKGDFPIDQVRVSIACREEATYRHGSSTSTAKEIFWEDTVAIASSLTASGGGELLRGEAVIPPQAMHSFKSSNNQIRWGIRVIMELPGRPDIDDFFEFRVEPPR